MIDSSFYKKAILISFFAKWFFYTIHSLLPLHQNHFWRQYDTLGVSIRYFQRFFLSGDPEPFFLRFLPAVLQSGESTGINPMEFPLLNLVSVFFWGMDSKWSRILASLLIVTANYGLCYFLYRKREKNEGIAYLLVPFVSFSAEYLYKFLPDVTGALLVACSVVFALEKRLFLAFLFCCTGALMKPPSLAALFLLLYYRDSLKELIRKDFFWSAAAGGVALFYYVFGLQWMRSLADGATFFVGPRDPLESLRSTFSDPLGFLSFLNFQGVYWGGTSLALVLLFLIGVRGRTPRLLAVFFLSVLFVVILDGPHSLVHSYYYAGASFSVCLLVHELICSFKPEVRIQNLFMGAFMGATLVIHPIELLIHDFGAIGQTLSGTTEEDFCDELKQSTPEWPWNQNHAFRSEDLPFPQLGVCFRERVGARTSKFGLFYSNSPLPAGCSIEKQVGTIVLAKCI